MQRCSLKRSAGGKIAAFELDGRAANRSLDRAIASGAGQLLARDDQRQAHDVGPELVVEGEHPLPGDRLLSGG